MNKIKNYFKNLDVDVNSYIWVPEEECKLLYSILWYNGVKIARISEENDIVKVVFFCTRRQLRKIKRDVKGFKVNHKAAWTC